MPPAEPPTPTHEEMLDVATDLEKMDLVETGLAIRSFVDASEQKDARIAELEREVEELKRRHEPTEEIL